MSPIWMMIDERAQMRVWQIALAILALGVIGIFVGRFLNRFLRDSDRHRVTIPAVFLYKESFFGRVELQDKGRLASNNTNVVMEQHKLTFLDEARNTEITFQVPGDVSHAWEEGTKGKLIYSGKRFIAFQTG